MVIANSRERGNFDALPLRYIPAARALARTIYLRPEYPGFTCSAPLKRIFLGFVEKPWVERLTDIGCLTREVVPLRKTALSLTAPFHQSCRSHVVFATQVEVKNI